MLNAIAYKNYYKYEALLIFNNLTLEIKLFDNSKSFKFNLKKHLGT